MHLLLALYFMYGLVLAKRHEDKAYNRLFEDIMARYNVLTRPVANPNDTIHIQFKMRLSMIVDVQEKDQVLTTNGWLSHRWFDFRLRWSPDAYGGIRYIQIPGEMIWLPDIILYNNAHGSPSVLAITKARVRHDGFVTWEPPVIYYSFCQMDIQWYPYDIQLCPLKFGSWTYSGEQLDLIHLNSDEVNEMKINNESVWQVERGVDITNFQESVEWDLLSVIGTRHAKWYPCCDYPSIDITYHLNIRRKKLFYTVHLIFPCASIAALASWVFYLPVESHQKIQLCVSILVSLTVFFLLLTDIIPPTSLATPLILKYLTFTMFMVSLSVILTVIVQNVHFRTSEHTMSAWTRRTFIQWLAPKLHIITRTNKEKDAFKKSRRETKRINALSAMSILEKQFQKTVFDIEMATKAKKENNMATVNSLFLDLPMMNRSKSVKTPSAPVKQKREQRMRRLLSSDTGKQPEFIETLEATGDRVRDKLRQAERNVHYIAKTLTEKRKAEEYEAEWRIVALVMDRILLIVFAVTITIGTLATILSAPSMTDDRSPLTVDE